MSKDRIRPSFWATDEHEADAWWPIVERIRNLGVEQAEKLLEEPEPDEQGKLKFNSKDETISSEGTKIKTLDQLKRHGDINEDKWMVDKYIENSWGVSGKKKVPMVYNDDVYFSSDWIYSTNWQVKAWLKRRGLEEPDKSWTKKWLKEITQDLTLPDKQYIDYEGKPAVVSLGDLHIGAVTEDTKVVPDYNVEACRESIQKIAWICNNVYADRPIYFLIGGDLIETFTGKNHKDTWKAIELHGSKAALEAFKILRDLFMNVDGFQKALLVSGNHDRISSSNKDDSDGQVVELLHGIFQETTNIETEYDPLIISENIDGVNYIMDHGHQGIKKKSAERIVLDYGDSKVFNQIVEFHDHHRDIEEDAYNVRRMKCPSIVKSTEFSQRMGLNSRSGFLVYEANDSGSTNYSNYDL